METSYYVGAEPKNAVQSEKFWRNRIDAEEAAKKQQDAKERSSLENGRLVWGFHKIWEFFQGIHKFVLASKMGFCNNKRFVTPKKWIYFRIPWSERWWSSPDRFRDKNRQGVLGCCLCFVLLMAWPWPFCCFSLGLLVFLVSCKVRNKKRIRLEDKVKFRCFSK